MLMYENEHIMGSGVLFWPILPASWISLNLLIFVFCLLDSGDLNHLLVGSLVGEARSCDLLAAC